MPPSALWLSDGAPLAAAQTGNPGYACGDEPHQFHFPNVNSLNPIDGS